LAWKLALKTLRIRTLFDVIPLDAGLVKGSHGRLPEDPQDWPVLIGDLPKLPRSSSIAAHEVFGHLYEHCSRGSGYGAVGV
ncbi:MAG TPA: alkaline phosphatase family protein, partial [Verrucomicrobium sp.]|nr:alkaline phosphatase family protein [Verrucomicrobium sp.]